MRPVVPRDPRDGKTYERMTYGANQPQYLPLPALRARDDQGRVVTEWELTAEDLAKIVAGGRIRISLLTFMDPLQPLIVEVTE